jgi:hypothetical protein
LEKGRKDSYLCSPLSNEKPAPRIGNEENSKNFFLSGSWKKQKAAYLCTPLQPEADLLKNELLSEARFEKKFFRKGCNFRKAAYLCNPLRSEGADNTNTSLLSSGTR